MDSIAVVIRLFTAYLLFDGISPAGMAADRTRVQPESVDNGVTVPGRSVWRPTHLFSDGFFHAAKNMISQQTKQSLERGIVEIELMECFDFIRRSEYDPRQWKL
jgi:hypothetical protein